MLKKKLNLKCQNVTKNISKILEIWKKRIKIYKTDRIICVLIVNG